MREHLRLKKLSEYQNQEEEYTQEPQAFQKYKMD